MDLRKLKTLIDLVSESNVSELEITEAEGKVRIVKASGVPMMMMHQPAMAMAAAPVTAAPVAVAGSRQRLNRPAMRSSRPWSARFTARPAPAPSPFVEIGSVVKEGETVCIIEAMKILNEIEADKSGTVTKILSENGQAVEYGQPLFMIE